jgi:hypothetical protein
MALPWHAELAVELMLIQLVNDFSLHTRLHHREKVGGEHNIRRGS